MPKHNSNKGFTLIEIVVVLVILAVLMAVAVPSVMSYFGETDKAHALDETYACVTAGDYYGLQAYKGKIKISDLKNTDIATQAEVSGTVSAFLYEDNKIIRLVYKSTEGIRVVYENDEYKFLTDNDIDPSTVIGMMQVLQEMATDPAVSSKPNTNASNGRSITLQQEFLKAYANTYPKLTETEIKYITSYNSSYTTYLLANAQKLVWKPLYDKEGTIFLVADSKTTTEGAALGPLLYYKGQYYIHIFHSNFDKVTDKYIGEASLTTLNGIPYDSELNNEWILVK